MVQQIKNMSSTDSTASSTSTTVEQLNSISRRSKALTPDEELARKVVPKLASRSYHLPGYNLRQDYLQYMFNNHPLFGICFHHKLHPLKIRQRLIILLGSFAFGVAITNAIYLWFFYNPNASHDEQVFAINLSTGSDEQSKSQDYYLTSGLLVLVTIGSGSHAVFDRFVWSITACSCCQPGGRFESSSIGACVTKLGFYVTILITTIIVAMATCIVLTRASIDDEESSTPFIGIWNSTSNSTIKEDVAQILDFNDFTLNDYSFLKGYAVEFAVSLFIYYPLMETGE